MSFPFLPLLFFLFWPVVADLSYNDERTKFSFGTFKDKYYGQPNFLQIPINQQGRERLAVPKAFYHFSENEVSFFVLKYNVICPQLSTVILCKFP